MFKGDPAMKSFKKNEAGFVLHLERCPVQQQCHSGLIFFVATERSHSLSLLGPLSQLSSALNNGKLS